MNNKNFIIIIALLLLASSLVFQSYLPQQHKNIKEAQMADFPKTIGEWVSADITLRERDYEILETRNLIVRDYKNSKGQSVNLYIIYSQDSRKAVHPPEICYSGGGSTILEKSVIPLTVNIDANRFIIEEKDFQQIVVYWFKSGSFSTYNYMRQQLKVVTDRMFRRKTSSAMVRLSTDIKDNNRKEALGLLKAFTEQIEPLLAKYVP